MTTRTPFAGPRVVFLADRHFAAFSPHCVLLPFYRRSSRADRGLRRAAETDTKNGNGPYGPEGNGTAIVLLLLVIMQLLFGFWHGAGHSCCVCGKHPKH